MRVEVNVPDCPLIIIHKCSLLFSFLQTAFSTVLKFLWTLIFKKQYYNLPQDGVDIFVKPVKGLQIYDNFRLRDMIVVVFYVAVLNLIASDYITSYHTSKLSGVINLVI